jgi:hypothetical protein
VLLLFLLARVDGFLAIPMLAAFLILEKSGASLMRRLSLIVPAAIAFGVLLCIRLYMTGEIWPNTVLAKSPSSIENYSAGLLYVFSAYNSSWLATLQGLSFVIGGVLVFFDYTKSISSGTPLVLPIQFRILVWAVALQNFFCILVGGNWMEYYRFWVPTLILQNCLLLYVGQWTFDHFTSYSKSRRVFASTIVLLTFFAAIEQQRDIGRNDLWAPNISGQSTPIAIDFLSKSLADYGKKTLLLNGSSRRDIDVLLPFIRDYLPRYLRNDRPLRVVSYQAGFFPFMLRKYYSPQQVLFYDLVGLATLEVARLDVPKNFIGAVWGTDMQRVFSGQAGALSEYVSTIDPDLIYVLGGDPDMKSYFNSIGFQVVYERPQALVLFRASDRSQGS